MKKLSQRGRGENSLCGFFFFLARKFTQSSIHLGKRWLLITKNRYLKIVILVLFYFFSSCLQRGKNLGLLKFLQRYPSDCLRACLPRALSASSCLSSWTPLGVRGRWAAAVGSHVTRVELGGEQCSLLFICTPLGIQTHYKATVTVWFWYSSMQTDNGYIVGFDTR